MSAERTTSRPRVPSPRRPHVEVDAVQVEAFGLAEDRGPFDTGWHRHAKHQVLWASRGSLWLTVGRRRWTLPPQRGAWLAAGMEHRVTATAAIELRTAYLDHALFEAGAPSAPCAVFALTPLARELLLAAMRFGPETRPGHPVGQPLFRTIAALCPEWCAESRPLWLPTGTSAELQRAMDYALENLGHSPTLEAAAKYAGLSVRTLSRRFETEAQTTWRRYLRSARVLRAVELLSRPRTRVTQVGYEVGFESSAAFAHAFRAVTGEAPSAYRDRLERG